MSDKYTYLPRTLLALRTSLHYTARNRFLRGPKLVNLNLRDLEWRGIIIFDVNSEEEVQELIQNDPVGRLYYELHPWWSEKGACFIKQALFSINYRNP